ncbi:MAG: CtsR family transcriptional regulator [Negativicoccus massiliensis]|uniref:CtsR family transcriptional regulator n=1 Tax=Negativicoccus succinicivorans TaxID=620903 RepID=UPI002910C3BB|nr:CtsR family transcriptional regulator [Negativicoccus succinicivorans]MDU4641776.1 CtsR family transcriptional regulator [Negativicoccus massiliensis]MDU5395366.1 CtsR family transcriptional regulator [Negativicoccus succinicivorans]
MGKMVADRIERFIMRRFLEEKAQEIILQRKEIADALNCAPSQISYVLSTRFSPEKGFSVESRRGLGGFIRITVIRPLVGEDNDRLTIADIDKGLYNLLQEAVITQREAQFLHEAFVTIWQETEGDMRRNLMLQLQKRINQLF